MSEIASQYVLRRDGAPPLRFLGRLITESTSRRNDSTRWTDVSVYRSQSGKWILQTIGRTIWEGEVDRYSVIHGDSAADLIKKIETKDCMTHTIQMCLESAAEVEEEMKKAYGEDLI
jgi:hypothetical protein